MKDTPALVLIAGPNGAGKSTLLAESWLQDIVGSIPFINPDNIALALDATRRDTPDVQIAAGRQALAKRKALLAAGSSFGIETTLSGNSELALIETAKRVGYRFYLLFIGLDSAIRSRNRVDLRVASGGHQVSKVDTDRRYPQVMANLPQALDRADLAWMFDNSGRSRQLHLTKAKGELRQESASLPMWLERALEQELGAMREADSGEP